MTPRRSLTGFISELGFMQSLRIRALIFVPLIALAALLAFFPERYNAAVTLTPADPQSLGLSNTNVLQVGGLGNVFGNQSTAEIALRVANSKYVRDIVIKQAKLESRLDDSSLVEIHRWLEKRVVIRSLRGTIMMIELKLRDPELARDVVAAYADATRDRLAVINRDQTDYKRTVLEKLIGDQSAKLASAEAAYNAFRLRNRMPSPESAVMTVTQRIEQLESAIKAKQIAIAGARQLYTDQNPTIIQMNAEVAALQRQLAETRAIDPQQDANLGSAVAGSAQLFRLAGELRLQRLLYDNYLRFLENTTVEDMTSNANVRVLEPAFVETERQVWWPAVAGAVALLLAWGAVEFYRLRPPVGARLDRQEA